MAHSEIMSIEEAKEVLVKGQEFTQYIFRGPIAQKRRIVLFFKEDENSKVGRLHWCPEFGDRIANNKDCLPLELISDLKLEKMTPVFETEVAAAAQRDCCFSLLSRSLELSLDLETASAGVLASWLSALTCLMELVKKTTDLRTLTTPLRMLNTPRKEVMSRFSPIRSHQKMASHTPLKSLGEDEEEKFEFGEAHAMLGGLKPMSLAMEMRRVSTIGDATTRVRESQTRLSLVNILTKRTDRVKMLESQLTVLEAKLHKTGELLESPGADKRMAKVAEEEESKEGEKAEREALLRENQSLTASVERLTQALEEEKKKRAKLLDKVIEMQGNIRVFCRVRPSVANEQASVISFWEDETLTITDAETSSTKNFTFDKVFDQQSTQTQIFTEVSPLIHSCMDGFTVCIFAYGQTGTGKTYTMEGTEAEIGVNYRSLELLFSQVAEQQQTVPEVSYAVSLSVVEVYNEEIRDLLCQSKKCELREGPNGVYIPNLTDLAVTNIAEVRSIVREQAYPNREVRGTSMNEHSSRSHCLLFVTCKKTHSRTGLVRSGKLILIDLAGSERLKKSEVVGQGLKEAQAINKSLAALGNVISSLQTEATHVPYRDSKLTFLLQNCLGGGAKCLMFCQVSPSADDFQETKCTLQFAKRVRATKLGQAKRSSTAVTVVPDQAHAQAAAGRGAAPEGGSLASKPQGITGRFQSTLYGGDASEKTKYQAKIVNLKEVAQKEQQNTRKLQSTVKDLEKELSEKEKAAVKIQAKLESQLKMKEQEIERLRLELSRCGVVAPPRPLLSVPEADADNDDDADEDHTNANADADDEQENELQETALAGSSFEPSDRPGLAEITPNKAVFGGVAVPMGNVSFMKSTKRKHGSDDNLERESRKRKTTHKKSAQKMKKAKTHKKASSPRMTRAAKLRIKKYSEKKADTGLSAARRFHF